MTRSVDLNADVGEGMGEDAVLIPLLTSANVACGAHAGDTETMRRTIALARDHRVAVGAHPSFPDREGFGRRPMLLRTEDLEDCISEQIRALAEIARREGVGLCHVKPHGALYNAAAADGALAESVARAVVAVDPSLILVGLAASESISAALRCGLRAAHEVFADRAYAGDGSLLPRDRSGSVIDDPEAVAARTVDMVRDRAVTAVDGTRVALEPDTVCLHGDTPGAAVMARHVRDALRRAGVTLRAMSEKSG